VSRLFETINMLWQPSIATSYTATESDSMVAAARTPSRKRRAAARKNIEAAIAAMGNPGLR